MGRHLKYPSSSDECGTCWAAHKRARQALQHRLTKEQWLAQPVSVRWEKCTYHIARELWSKNSASAIARLLHVPRSTISTWARRSVPPWPRKPRGRVPNSPIVT